MGKCSIWQVIIVDWDSRTYATVDGPDDDEDWDGRLGTEREKGRDIHCFHHDGADTSGVDHWAEQHHLTRTEIAEIMPSA